MICNVGCKASVSLVFKITSQWVLIALVISAMANLKEQKVSSRDPLERALVDINYIAQQWEMLLSKSGKNLQKRHIWVKFVRP